MQLGNSLIEQLVEFNIAMDSYYRLYTLSLAPQIGLQENDNDNDMHDAHFKAMSGGMQWHASYC
jgi:hypothetical protein